MMITQNELKKLLHYNPETGVFTWKSNRSQLAKKGDIAGSVYRKCNGKEYIVIHVKGRVYKAHRLAWMHVHGRFPILNIDHINGIGTDNRMQNLRDVSHAENMKNKVISRNNSSGVPA